VDKTKLHLFGLSETSLSLDEMATRSGVSAVTGGADHHHLRANQSKFSLNGSMNPIERAIRKKVMQEASRHGGSTAAALKAKAEEYDPARA
jgi:hypothetical protein